MPTWLKILIIVFGSLFVIVVLVVFLAYRWVSANKDEIRSGMENISREAREFGSGKDAEACIAESIARHTKCGDLGVMCQTRANIFTIECMKVVETKPEFCASVPASDQLRELMKWSPAECARRGMRGSAPCTRAVSIVPQHCQQWRAQQQ